MIQTVNDCTHKLIGVDALDVIDRNINPEKETGTNHDETPPFDDQISSESVDGRGQRVSLVFSHLATSRLVDGHIASRGDPLSCPSHPVLSLRHVDLLHKYHRSDQTYLSWI